MKLNPTLLYSILAIAMLSACSDDSISAPDDSSADPRISFAYRVDNYGQGMSRADGTYCWQEDGWNENRVLSLDLFLIKEGIITAHMQNQKLIKTSDCLSHTFANYADLPDGFSITEIEESDHIALVANYRPYLEGNNVGKEFMTVYKNLNDLEIDSKQEGFVMVGYIPTPTDFDPKSTIEIPLQRIAAKIRVSLKSVSGALLDPSTFCSTLCRYVTEAQVKPEEGLPTFTETLADPASLFTTSVAVNGIGAGGDWDYPEDLTEPHDLIRDNGHVYYTYPSDWIDYSRVKNQCTRNGETDKGHNDDDHKKGLRYEVIDLDDRAPIKDSREMFLIVKAPYTNPTNGATREYFYKVPVNYRVSAINDQQCFSAADLTDKVFPLYRAERNHFYDITALIDRPGAATPLEATALRFTLTVAPLIDGGTYDYIYD
ncbi:MAG: hypothetical protein NC248_01060 [Bacteroides sp.]|nr:hypothetical protein [Bacteroides sp.]MCM1389358.1 hypothetical protein [Bacteroides sp.]